MTSWAISIVHGYSDQGGLLRGGSCDAGKAQSPAGVMGGKMGARKHRKVARAIEKAGMKPEIPFRHRRKQAFSCRYRETVGKPLHPGGGYLYYFSQADCSRCKRKESCLGDKETRKRVYFSERARNLLSCRPQLRELCDIARSWSASSQKPNAVARAGSSTLLGQVACNLKLMVRVLGT